MNLMASKSDLRDDVLKTVKMIDVTVSRIHLRSKWIPRVPCRVLLVGGLCPPLSEQYKRELLYTLDDCKGWIRHCGYRLQ